MWRTCGSSRGRWILFWPFHNGFFNPCSNGSGRVCARVTGPGTSQRPGMNHQRHGPLGLVQACAWQWSAQGSCFRRPVSPTAWGNRHLRSTTIHSGRHRASAAMNVGNLALGGPSPGDVPGRTSTHLIAQRPWRPVRTTQHTIPRPSGGRFAPTFTDRRHSGRTGRTRAQCYCAGCPSANSAGPGTTPRPCRGRWPSTRRTVRQGCC